MTGQEVVTLIYADKKGDWDAIIDVIKNKKDIEGTKEERESRLKEFSGRFPHVVTVVDEKYPSELKKASKPPFVIAYDGDISILSETPDHEDHRVVALESPILKKSFDKHQISNSCFMKSDKEWESKISFSVFDKSGARRTLDIYVHDDKSLSSIWGVTVSDFVAYDGEPKLCSEMEVSGVVMHAVPGRPGCRCNKLIKEGAMLCDSWEDFKDDK